MVNFATANRQGILAPARVVCKASARKRFHQELQRRMTRAEFATGTCHGPTPAIARTVPAHALRHERPRTSITLQRLRTSRNNSPSAFYIAIQRRSIGDCRCHAKCDSCRSYICGLPAYVRLAFAGSLHHELMPGSNVRRLHRSQFRHGVKCITSWTLTSQTAIRHFWRRRPSPTRHGRRRGRD